MPMIDRPRPPAVVSTFADELRRLLGDRLIGVYLGGSFSAGDFVEGSSDYDLLVLVATPLSPDDLAALSALHGRIMRAYPDAQLLEGDYVPLDWLIPEGTREPTPWFHGGRLQPNPEFMLSADNIADLRTDSIVLTGPPAEDVLPRVTPMQVRAAVREMLADLETPTNEAEAADEILDLLRSMRALETGAPATKSAGVQWGLTHLDPQWHLLVEQADATRRKAAVLTGEDTLRRGLERLRRLLLDTASRTDTS